MILRKPTSSNILMSVSGTRKIRSQIGHPPTNTNLGDVEMKWISMCAWLVVSGLMLSPMSGFATEFVTSSVPNATDDIDKDDSDKKDELLFNDEIDKEGRRTSDEQ